MRKTYKENKLTWKIDRCKKSENPDKTFVSSTMSDARHTLFLAEIMT